MKPTKNAHVVVSSFGTFWNFKIHHTSCSSLNEWTNPFVPPWNRGIPRWLQPIGKEGVFQPKNWVWWRWWQLSNRKYLVIVLVIVSYSHCNSHKTYYTLNHSGSFCQGKHICGSNSNGSSFQKQPLPVALVQDSVLLKQHNAVPWLQALCLSQAPAPSLGDGHWESGPIHRWRQNISNRTGYVTLCYIIYIYIFHVLLDFISLQRIRGFTWRCHLASMTCGCSKPANFLHKLTVDKPWRGSMINHQSWDLLIKNLTDHAAFIDYQF